ncbi:MAG: DUF5320 domain-containing protein [Candidatus Peribacteraceae bacterium]|nr:DUF5320 domain-containing protein [Candidatus Peribacteraceae bacterium]
MPRGDRTGPNGEGPRTGRAMGHCNGYNAPGFANPFQGPGFGRGMGRGAGRGFGRRFWAPRDPYPYPTEPVRQSTIPAYEYTKENEIADLKYEKDAIKRELEAIEKRLKEIEKKK